jgi:hypothetical protein
MRKWMLPFVVAWSVVASASEVVRVAPWEFHSSFWMSLHQSLLADAMRLGARDISTLNGDEKTAWESSVAAYRTAAQREGDVTFAQPMVITNDALSQVTDDAIELVTDPPLADALRRAAPVYRKHWWAADDEANRFFIAYASALAREAGGELVAQHETVYRTAWPKQVRVYVTPYAGPYGAYTMKGLAGGVITTMSSRDAGYQGFRALEMLLHESSHAIVGPHNGLVARAIADAVKKHDAAPQRDLWHAILFATTGELTRRLLEARGISAYVPSSEELFTRVWPQYRKPIEQHWYSYLNGEGTLEDAIGRIVAAVKR